MYLQTDLLIGPHRGWGLGVLTWGLHSRRYDSGRTTDSETRAPVASRGDTTVPRTLRPSFRPSSPSGTGLHVSPSTLQGPRFGVSWTDDLSTYWTLLEGKMFLVCL